MSLKDDKIWDDLRYWLEHPVTEEEQGARDKEINDYVAARLAQMYDD